METHFLISCIAAFSFLSSAGFMLMVKITSHEKLWRTLNRCRILLAMVFMVVGLSCLKNVFFQHMMSRNGIILSTLISASVQSMLLYITSMSFLQPEVVKRHFVLVNVLALGLSAAQLVAVFFLFPSVFIYSAGISVIVFLVFWFIYQFHFYRVYRQTIITSDLLTDEDTEVRYRWVKRFFISVSVLGITAVTAPFCSLIVYDVWMLCAALFYEYVVVSFINYFTSLSTIVSRVSVAPPPVVVHDEEQVDNVDFSEQYVLLEKNLSQWISRRGYVENDLVSDDLARQLGVNIVVFRAYFKEKKNTDFRQWRLKLRIDYACQIICEHPDYSYDAVANIVGIGDRSNFTKAFKRIKGITPREYSKSVENSHSMHQSEEC